MVDGHEQHVVVITYGLVCPMMHGHTYLVEDNMYGSFKCLYLQIVSLPCTLQ